ncbi:MAG TPA: DUF1003 domain-containing protein [Candidatus Limnocylindria bacterium]|jgi:uncharacterized membrane protein|nr:DUF1003 domain-containing protein [Candidatus Limnocylindria bacterium]
MNAKDSLETLTQRNVETIAKIEAASRSLRTRGERIADMIALCIGSWAFILTQAVLLAVWMILNLTGWLRHWDPYPFILLNLALSFQAAFAGPVLMMSQNRQSRFIERRNQLDLQINLLAEQENTETLRLLRLLCDKAGIGRDQSSGMQMLDEETQPDALMRQIAKTSQDQAASNPP